MGQSALHRLGGEGGPSRALPSLEVLFATPVEPMEDDIDYMAERWVGGGWLSVVRGWWVVGCVGWKVRWP